jgi:hypothetical protein
MSKHIVRSGRLRLVVPLVVGFAWLGLFIPAMADSGAGDAQAVAGRIQSRQVLCPPGSGDVLCTTGVFTGDLEGPFTFAVDAVEPSGVEGLSHMTEKVVVHAGDGDLFLEGAAVADLRSGRFAGLAKVTRGTGRWKGSSGEVRWSSGPTASGGREGEYTGIITVK